MMDGDTITNMLWGAGTLALVGSALMVRRIPLKRGVQMSLAWVVIFGLVYAAVALRGDAAALWSRASAAVSSAPLRAKGGAVQISKSDDGHFWTAVSLNGSPARFLVDSGATVTMISASAAQASHVVPMVGPALLVETANGTIRVLPARVARLTLGPITRTEERVQVNDSGDETNVLGMSFLSTLRSWHVDQDVLTLQP